MGSTYKIAPSILAADFTRLGEHVREAQEAGADMIHVDIMDGNYVPNLSMGPGIVKAVRGITDLPLDVHLMVMRPERFVRSFVDAGATNITFHTEVAGNRTGDMIDMIEDSGATASISLNPNTDIRHVYPYIHRLQMILIMSVYPGFGGQKFMPSMLDKIRTAASWTKDSECDVEVDGGVNRETATGIVAAGADVLVVGTGVFGQGSVMENIRKLRSCTNTEKSI